MDYTAEFQAFWTLYGSPKNSSKADAAKAWAQTRKYHPKPEMLLACVQAYNTWLVSEQTKNGNGFPAKCHAATWLRGLRFEGFMDDAEAILRAQDGHSQADLSATAKSWEGRPRALIMALVDPDEFGVWLPQTTFIPGQPVEIRSPSQFHRDELERRFGKVIRQAFGEDVQLTVAKKNGAD